MAEELSPAQLQRIFEFNQCPDCQGVLLAGPANGVMLNLLCRNCHQEFNVDTDKRASGHRNGVCEAQRLGYFGPVVVFNNPDVPTRPAPSRNLRGGL